MLDEQGGVIDDLIIYYLADDWFRIVVNAATRDKDMAWINRQAEAFGIEVRERTDLAMIAAQGPNARDKVIGLVAEDDRARVGKLGKFSAVEAKSVDRSEEHTSELQSLMRISYAVFCLKKKTNHHPHTLKN